MTVATGTGPVPSSDGPGPTAVKGDPRANVTRLLRDLGTTRDGLSQREADRRLTVHGPNKLSERGGRRWLGQLARQFTQPLALLLTAAAVLALVNGNPPLAIAIVAVVVLNAGFAFAQERHAEAAVAALTSYLPLQAVVRREGRTRGVDAADLVPGDVVLLEEGDRVSADARLLDGTVEVDVSTLTGESLPVVRSSEFDDDPSLPLLQAPDMVFSGSACVSGRAWTVVTATGMRTEIGRIAALSQVPSPSRSPLEAQVARVTRLIGVVSLLAAAAFVPLGLLAGLTASDAVSFAVGLLVANVPEGLLPTITLALAAGVSVLAARGAVVRRLSAVETLGSTTVICTDKTGTLTRNEMQVEAMWTADGVAVLRPGPPQGSPGQQSTRRLVTAAAACTAVQRTETGYAGDPTEIALVQLAEGLGAGPDVAGRVARRVTTFRFDPRLRLMTTIEASDAGATPSAMPVVTKGAPEAVLARSTRLAVPGGAPVALDEASRLAVAQVMDGFAARGLRVLAVAEREWAVDKGAAEVERGRVESDLTLLGLVALLDPPRPEVARAIADAHLAGIKIHVVTGDNPVTAAEIAREVGIGSGHRSVTVPGDHLDRMSDRDLDALLQSGPEIVFARSSPEAKLRIADSLRAHGEVVAMTGDGVNDAPALRRADIGVAMGRSGTEVARQAATMVLTDDDFATIVDAVAEGRRVYDNVRKFIFYIFSHTVPEVIPFLAFALSGGAIPLPLTVLQVLAIDLVTDTLPALALGREPAEPGLMTRPPRRREESVVSYGLLWRAWGVVGVPSAVLVMAGFFTVLLVGGWQPYAASGPGTALHQTYLQATIVAWLGIVACQVGTATAARTEHASLRGIGLFSNPLLSWAILAEVLLSLAIVYAPPLQAVFGTAALPLWQVALVLPFPVVVWGIDELRRYRLRAAAHEAEHGSRRAA